MDGRPIPLDVPRSFRHLPIPDPYVGDVIFFLHSVPMIGALALRPHDRRDDLRMHLGYINFTLLLLWWVYLYLFIVTPWQYVSLNVARYDDAFDSLEGVQNLFLAGGLAVLYFQARGQMAHHLRAPLLRLSAIRSRRLRFECRHRERSLLHRQPLRSSASSRTSLVRHRRSSSAAIQWKSRRLRTTHKANQPVASPSRPGSSILNATHGALCGFVYNEAPPPVRNFQIAVTQIAVIAAGLLVFLRQRLVDRDRERLLKASQDALENLRHYPDTNGADRKARLTRPTRRRRRPRNQ